MARVYNLDESIVAGDPEHPETHVAIAAAVNDLDDRVEELETNGTGGGGGGGSTAWNDITGKPAVIAAGATATEAKTAIGLENVSNTSDANKPVSTAQQEALDEKAPKASPAFTGNPTAPTQTAGDNSTKLATTGFVTAAVAAGGGGGGGGGNSYPRYMRPKVGEYVAPFSDANSQNSLAFNDTDFYQVFLPEGTYSSIAVTVNTGGSSGVTIRSGVYAMDSTQTDIGALICQTGEVAAATSGDKVGTLDSALVVPAGGNVYWVGVTAHGSGTPPVVQMMRGPSSQTPWYVMPSGGINLSGILMWGLRKSVSGSFPSTITDAARGWFNDKTVKVAFLRSA